MDNMNMQKEKNNLGVRRVANILREKGFEVPNNFEKEVGDTAYLYSSKDIREVLKICSFWRPYVGEDNYNEFVVNVFKKFLRIQCVSINSNPNCRILYVGDRISGELKGIPLMKELVTTRFSRGGNAVSDSTKYPI